MKRISKSRGYLLKCCWGSREDEWFLEIFVLLSASSRLRNRIKIRQAEPRREKSEPFPRVFGFRGMNTSNKIRLRYVLIRKSLVERTLGSDSTENKQMLFVPRPLTSSFGLANSTSSLSWNRWREDLFWEPDWALITYLVYLDVSRDAFDQVPQRKSKDADSNNPRNGHP